MGSTVFATVSTPGPPGPQGPTGPPGTSPVWIVAAGAPANTTGANGDMYLNSSTGDVYGPKAGGIWGPIACNIKGPTGATGAAGYSPQYIVAAGAPSPAVGNNGDMYLNSTTSDLYGPKSGGLWGGIVSNIKGATGAQGPPGVAYTPKGQWLVSTSYTQGDEVTDAGVLYISLQTPNVGHTPATSPTWWQPVATGGGGGSQTPWLSNIDGAGFTLGNVAKVGIGVTGPTHPLHVYATATTATSANTSIYIQRSVGSSFAGIGFSGVVSNNPMIYCPINTDALAFGGEIGGTLTEWMRITAGGNVGIGTMSPVATFNVASTAVAGGPATSGTTDTAIETRIYSITVGTVLDFGTNGSGVTWIQNRSNANYATQFPLALNPNGGSVGISTMSPNFLVSLGSAVTARKLAVYDAGGDFFGFGVAGGMLRYDAGASSAHVFFSNNNQELMRISATGNVGIGYATPQVPLTILASVQDPNLSTYSGFTWLIGANGVTLSSGIGASFNGAWLQSRFLTNTDGRVFGLFLNPLGGAVGIGISSTVYSLDVNLTSHTSQTHVIRWGSSSVGTLGFLTEDPTGYFSGALALYRNGNPNSFISANGVSYFMGGNVGIAKNNPGFALDVTGDINTTGVFRVNGTPISTGGGAITTRNVVTGSRAFNTNYGPNSTGKPMFVAICCSLSVNGFVQFVTDATTNPTTMASNFTNGSASVSVAGSVCAWVMPGEYYKAALGPAGGSITTWIEWY